MIVLLTEYLKYDKNLSFKFVQRIKSGSDKLIDLKLERFKKPEQ